jgi:hypothetical protein
MKTGDSVTIICQGCTVVGNVLLASSNGKSIMLGFEAILANHVGTMPVLLDDDGVYRSLVNSVDVILIESPGIKNATEVSPGGADGGDSTDA